MHARKIATSIYQKDFFIRFSDAAFEKWVHSDIGREIADHFIKLAYGLHKRGFKHYGAKSIVERLRWHYMLKNVRCGKNEYKLNNNWTSRLARFAMQKAPILEGFFELRGLKNGI